MADNITKEFWEAFGDSGPFIEVECEGEGSLAYKVLNYYGIPCNDTSGGELKNIDIPHMDALSLVRLSLLEEAALAGHFIEPTVNSNGEVEFKSIGTYGGDVKDIYYTIQSMSYKEECKGVMVKGRKPRPIRKVPRWKPIWGNDGRDIYDTTLMKSNCLKNNFSQYATIVFNDPQLDSKYEDGIENLYEITKDNPYDVIVGYAKYKNPPQNLITADTTINYNNRCSIPIKVSTATDLPNIPDIGELIDPPQFNAELTSPACWAGLGEQVLDPTKGMKIPIPRKFRFENVRGSLVDKFEKISQVYLIGMPIDHLLGGPQDDAISLKSKADLKPEDIEISVTIDKPNTTVIRLEEGKHYVIAYEDDTDLPKQPYIVFANNSRINDPSQYGWNKEFMLDETCMYYKQTKVSRHIGTILPLEDTKGFLVTDVWAIVDLQTPCIVVYDPNGDDNRALKIAEELEYYITPIVIVDEPSPLAFNGNLIDQSQGKQDHDPTTQQNFEDTDLERAGDIMNGGGLSLNLSFLDEKQVIDLSTTLYDYMNSGSGVETTYVCGPDCEPKLGGYGPSGGIINNISYSYSDGGSYTISVNEGPRLIGNLSQIDAGISMKMSESISMKGTIIQDLGNHIHYKVHIDGLNADRYAINCCFGILRVGDVVQCTIHNSPIEK